jgi:hypothetical protein
MLSSLLLTAYLLVASFSLYILAFFLYFQDRRSSELRWAAMIMFSAGVTSLAIASLLWMEIRPALKTAAPTPPPVHAISAEKDVGPDQ